MDEQLRARLREMFPGLTDEQAMEAMKKYKDGNDAGRELMTMAAKWASKQEFENIHRLAYDTALPSFDVIMKETGSAQIGFEQFYDAVVKHKLFPDFFIASAMQEIFSQYNFYRCGEKIYNIHANLCRRFMATNIKAVPVELFGMPFQAFKILVPDGILPYTTFEKKRVFIREIFVSDYTEPSIGTRTVLIFHRAFDDIGFFKVLIDKDEVHECVEASVKRMIEFTTLQAEASSKENEFTEVQQRELREIFEFAIKTILYITGAESDVVWHDEVRALYEQMDRLKSAGKRKKMLRRIERARREFLVGHNIVLSREERMMYDNIQSGKWTVSYRFVVQGHYRNQACGPGRADRKLIYIAPFWKGPEYADVVNNPHVVK